MKSPRLIQGLVAVLCLFATCTSQAQSVQGTLPLKQTVNGLTLSITKAGFYRGNEEQTWGAFRTGDDQQTSFSIAYEVTSTQNAAAQDAATQDKGAQNITDVHLFAPLGGPLLQRSISRSSDGGLDKWSDVAAYWDHVGADFEWRDPAAPTGADGKFEETLEFNAVPMPDKFNVPRDVGQTILTKHGTPITIDQVLAKAEEDQKGFLQTSLQLTVSWASSKQVPDLMAELELQDVTDGAGKEYASDGSNSRQQNHYTLTLRDLPPKSDKPLKVRLKVSEEAPSLKQMRWFRHFLFDLKLPGLAAVEANQVKTNVVPNANGAPNPDGAPDADVKPVLAGAEGVTAQLDSDSASNYSLQARLWLRDSQPLPAGLAPDPLRAWFVKAIKGRDGAGKVLESSWDPMSSDDLYFKADGKPAHPDERSQLFEISFPDGKKPQKLALEATVEAARHQHAVFDFTKVPIPPPGETRAIDQEMKAANGARTILHSVCAFTGSAQLPGVAGTLHDWHQIIPASGLALVFEMVPVLGPGAQHFLKETQATDAQGRRLHRHEYVTDSPGNALVKGQAQPHWWTVYLLPPAADETTFNLQVTTDEVLPTGPSRTLTFPDVPLPAEKVEYLFFRSRHVRYALRP